MEPDWVRRIKAQCDDQDVPFFFKQWGGVFKTNPEVLVVSVWHFLGNLAKKWPGEAEGFSMRRVEKTAEKGRLSPRIQSRGARQTERG
jgi:hypothetical protein